MTDGGLRGETVMMTTTTTTVTMIMIMTTKTMMMTTMIMTMNTSNIQTFPEHQHSEISSKVFEKLKKKMSLDPLSLIIVSFLCLV